jgi:hypothetical protein
MTAATPETGPRPAPKIDDRKEPRIPVSWRGQLALPNGMRTEVRVKDVSESGIGIVSPDPVPNMSRISVAMAVPDLIDPGRSVTVTGQLSVAYVVVQRHDYRIGGQWVDLPNAQREMLKQVIKRHRFG